MPKKLQKLLNKKYFSKIYDYYDAKADLIADINEILAAEPFGDLQGVVCGAEVKGVLREAVELYGSIPNQEDPESGSNDF